MKVSDEISWDPEGSERTYYRSSEDGQRGYLVRMKDGRDMIRLDRPMEVILHKPSDQWKLDTQVYPISEVQIAQVAFVADRALCGALGKHRDAREDWLNLTDKARLKFMREGPCTGDVRDQLNDAIVGTLRGLIAK